jgi:hypothetical protein
VVTVSAERSDSGWLCEVKLVQAGAQTNHSVTVTQADLERWGDGSTREEVERLVERSFQFLLEREPPSAILNRFGLSVISRYFPDYDRVIRRI